MPCKSPFPPGLETDQRCVGQAGKGRVQGCALLCKSRTCKRGGVCSKHWSTLFKKQLFPVLINPQPTVNPLGQVVSTEAEKRAALFFPAKDDCDGGVGSWYAAWGV
jgi:hypothetical protein